MRNAYLTTLGVFAAILTVVALALLLAPGFAGSVTADSDDNGGEDGGEDTEGREVGVSHGAVSFRVRNGLLNGGYT